MSNVQDYLCSLLFVLWLFMLLLPGRVEGDTEGKEAFSPGGKRLDSSAIYTASIGFSFLFTFTN